MGVCVYAHARDRPKIDRTLSFNSGELSSSYVCVCELQRQPGINDVRGENNVVPQQRYNILAIIIILL